MKLIFSLIVLLYSGNILSIKPASPMFPMSNTSFEVHKSDSFRNGKTKKLKHFRQFIIGAKFSKSIFKSPIKDANISILTGLLALLLFTTGYVLTFVLIFQIWPLIVFSAISLILGLIGFSKGLKSFGKRNEDGSQEKKLRNRALWGLVLNAYLFFNLLLLGILFLYYGY